MSARDQRPEDSPELSGEGREKDQPEDVTDLPTDIPDMEPQGFLPPPDAPKGADEKAAAGDDPRDPDTEEGTEGSIAKQELGEPEPTVEADSEADLTATIDSTDPGVRPAAARGTPAAAQAGDEVLSGPVIGALVVGLVLGLGLAWMTSDLWRAPAQPATVEVPPTPQPAEAVEPEPVVEPVVEAVEAEEAEAEEAEAAEAEAAEAADGEGEEPAEAEGTVEEPVEAAEGAVEEPAGDADGTVEEPAGDAAPPVEEATADATAPEEPAAPVLASGDFDPRVKGELQTFYFDDHFWWQFDFQSPDPLVLRWIAPDGAVGLDGYSCANRINSEVGRCYVGQHLTRFASKPGMWKLQACSNMDYTACAVVDQFEVQEGLKPTK